MFNTKKTHVLGLGMALRWLALTLTLLLSGLACAQKEVPPHHLLMLMDVGSLSVGSSHRLPVGLEDRIGQLFGQWLATASAGSRAELMVFPRKGSPVEVETEWFTEIPKFRAPVKLNRDTFVQETSKKFVQAVAEIKPVEGSPLLEATWRAQRHGGGLVGTYEVVLCSDLLQTSSLVEFTQQYLSKHKDAEIVGKVIQALPRPQTPPEQVTLYYAPGDPNDGHRVTGSVETRIKNLFRQILVDEWKLPAEHFKVVEYL